MSTEFEPVIGLEVHCQLATDSKLFCGCRARLTDEKTVAEEAVNGNTCPVCAGHPGTLPVLNKKAVEFAVMAGLATGCKINLKSVFSRKNYFYPDLPKGYQISQYDLPICEHGYLEIDTKTGNRKINIQRIHMEEDAGKNVHMSGFSVVNLNRACVPLIEIVSGPDIRTSEEAGAYLRKLHAIVTTLEICDGNMQEGNFRCDANVSVRPKGTEKFGTRAEIKNVNSFKFVEKAIEYEIARQIEVINAGGKIVQETRGYDSAAGKTYSLRTKEEAHDYRYFPEPDLIPLTLKEKAIEEIKSKLPELPTQKKDRYIKEYSLSSYDAGVLTASKKLSQFFENTIDLLKTKKNGDASAVKTVTNLLTGEVSRLLNEESIEIHQSKLLPQHLADLTGLLKERVLSSTAGKQVLATVWKTGDAVDAIVDREGLRQVSDTGAIEKIVDQVIAQFPQQAAELKSGKDKLLGFFVGHVMKASAGKANPGLAQEIIKKKLS